MQQLLQHQTEVNTELEAELKVLKENNEVVYRYIDIDIVYLYLMSFTCLVAFICQTLSGIILNFRGKIRPSSPTWYQCLK